jgi:histidinol-phosphate aminotransferase
MGAGEGFAGVPVPGVLGLAPYVPGKPVSELERELGLSGSIKLASNENPLGPPPASVAAVREAAAEIGWYPDGGAFALKGALAERFGMSPDGITIGNGSNDILVMVAEAYLGPGSNAVYSAHAFAIYALATQATGAASRVVPARPADGPQPRGHDLAALAAAIDARTRVVFVANPNNPTGTWCGAAELAEFLARVPAHVLVVLDEAYAEYVTAADYPDALPWLARHPNLLITRTFSKIYGLAGLRVGYALSDPAVAAVLNRVRQPFNVGSLAQAAALAALAADDHVARSRALNTAGRDLLRSGLAAFGWQVPESMGNFVLADTGGPAQPWYDHLLRRGVIVRPVANYGLSHHLRITVGLPEQTARLLDALAAIRRELQP